MRITIETNKNYQKKEKENSNSPTNRCHFLYACLYAKYNIKVIIKYKMLSFDFYVIHSYITP